MLKHATLDNQPGILKSIFNPSILINHVFCLTMLVHYKRHVRLPTIFYAQCVLHSVQGRQWVTSNRPADLDLWPVSRRGTLLYLDTLCVCVCVCVCERERECVWYTQRTLETASEITSVGLKWHVLSLESSSLLPAVSQTCYVTYTADHCTRCM